MLICQTVTPFSVSYLIFTQSWNLPTTYKNCDSMDPFGGTGFPPCTETSFCSNVIESFLLSPDIYIQGNKEKEEPFLTYVHKGNAVFLEKQWKDLRAASASALRSSKIDRQISGMIFLRITIPKGTMSRVVHRLGIGYPSNWCYHCIAEEAPLVVQEMPAYAAKAGPVMAWLECCIRITVIANATGVIFFFITHVNAMVFFTIHRHCNASEVMGELFKLC